jgi:predicted enzyme related to lactoylglutathione lyase
MQEIKKHQPGTFCWIDLATTDLGAAKEFYILCRGSRIKYF